MATGHFPRNHLFDAFFSHASEDSRVAARLVKFLETNSLTSWIDRSSMRFGSLLRNELHDAIRDSRTLVLVWSKAASKSRWVMAEILVAFHLNRFIIPCVLDETPLPQFLGNTAYVDRRRDKSSLGAEVFRSIREAPAHANEIAPLIASRTPVVQSLANRVAAAQYRVLATITTDLKKAATANTVVDKALRSLKKLAPLDVTVMNLSGYQCKNNYMVKHWQKIQAGQAPKDPLLISGERHFFDTLSVNPRDESAINGIGSILFYERELQAAAFFQRRAIELAKPRGGNYKAAQLDLELTLSFMGRSGRA
jgi:hypothetical protein